MSPDEGFSYRNFTLHLPSFLIEAGTLIKTVGPGRLPCKYKVDEKTVYITGLLTNLTESIVSVGVQNVTW